MSSNDEMYSILTPSLSLSPTPFFGFFFFLFFSLRASFLASLKYSRLYLLYLFLFTDQILTVRSIQFSDDPLCRKGKRYITYE